MVNSIHIRGCLIHRQTWITRYLYHEMGTSLNIWTTCDSDYLHAVLWVHVPCAVFTPLPWAVADTVSSGHETRDFGRGVPGTEAARARDRYASGLFRLGVVGLTLEDELIGSSSTMDSAQPSPLRSEGERDRKAIRRALPLQWPLSHRSRFLHSALPPSI